MKYRISTSNERVWRTAQRAKLSFNNSIGHTHSWRVNGWNSTLQAAWYIRHVEHSYNMFLWTKPTIWLLILSFTKKSFARGLCFILMKDIEKRQLWVRPMGGCICISRNTFMNKHVNTTSVSISYTQINLNMELLWSVVSWRRCRRKSGYDAGRG